MQLHQIKFISEIILYEIKIKRKDQKNLKILEIGCGDGSGVIFMRKILNQLYKDLNVEIFGIDYEVESENVQKTNYFDENLIKLKSTYEPYPFDLNYFDYIYSNQVLEHVENFELFVFNVSKVLKKSGIFIGLYPEKNIIREPHCLIPFVHRVKNKKFKKAIVKNLYPFCSYLNGLKPINAKTMANYIVNNTFYRSRSEIRKEFIKVKMNVQWPISPSYASFHLMHNSFPRKNIFIYTIVKIVNFLWRFWKSSLIISYHLK